jgi:hypothetical protein
MTTKINFKPIILALSLASASLACPTRVAYMPDSSAKGGSGGGETKAAGHGGSQTDAGGQGGIGGGDDGGATAVAGAGGSALAGTAGIAGAAGANGTGGIAGANGTGGTAGANGTGGTAGANGTGGMAGVTGTGGSPPICSPACNSSGQTCVGTRCLFDDGQSCALASQCVSNTCTPFYVDQDNDGYGTGQAVGFCGTKPPVGYAAQTGDCCDTASNLAIAKLIHPNAGFQSASALGVCGITWDYDCDGTVERSFQECSDCSAYPTCSCIFVDFPEGDCGMTEGIGGCVPTDGANFCTSFGNPDVLKCR